MDTQRVRNLLVEKGCDFSSTNTDRILSVVSCQSVCNQVHTYCTDLMTTEGVMASGLGLLGSDRVFDENHPDVTPGRMLNKYGFLVLAISIGGNALAVHVESGVVYWAEKSTFFYEGKVALREPSGEYSYQDCSPRAVEEALTKLSDDLGGFLYMLLADELIEKMNELDS